MKDLKKRIREKRWNSVGDIFAMIGLSIAGVLGIVFDGLAQAEHDRFSWFDDDDDDLDFDDTLSSDLFDGVGKKSRNFKKNRKEIKKLKVELLEKEVSDAKETITNSEYDKKLIAYLKTLITKCSYLENREQKRFLLSIKKVLAKYAKEYNTYANTINGQAIIVQKIMERLAIIEKAIDKRLIKTGNIILTDKKLLNTGNETVIVSTKKMSI